MKSVLAPLRALDKDALWFVRKRELRLLHVATDDALRAKALDVLMAHAFGGFTEEAFFRIEDGFSAKDRRWAERAARLREAYEEHRAAQPELPPIPAFVEQKGDGGPLLVFAWHVHKLYEALSRPPAQTKGIVVLLAPTVLRDGERFADELGDLLEVKQLRAVRWIWVECGASSAGRLLKKLGDGAMSVRRVKEDDAAENELLLASIATRGVAAVGRAGPSKIPPPRRGRDGRVLPAAPGPSEPAARLAELIVKAVLAAKQGRALDAVRAQGEAVKHALENPGAIPLEQAVAAEMGLGSYQLRAAIEAKAPIDAALTSFAQASARAGAGGVFALAAQAQLTLGNLHCTVTKDPERAIRAFQRAADLAIDGDSAALAIEALRMCGALADDHGLVADAIRFWRRAIEVAEPKWSDLRESTVTEVVARLVALYRKNGQSAEAATIEIKIAQLEASATGGRRPPTPPAGTDPVEHRPDGDE